MLEVGAEAPEFELKDQDGASIRLSDYRGKLNVVLFFYPKDNTLVCTLEVCAFRDSHADLIEHGAVILGVSRDTERSHLQIKQRWRLTYPLLTDTDGTVTKAYQVGRTLGLFRGRVTYIIDRDGIIQGACDNPLRASAHVKEALRTLRAQRTS